MRIDDLLYVYYMRFHRDRSIGQLNIGSSKPYVMHVVWDFALELVWWPSNKLILSFPVNPIDDHLFPTPFHLG